jgi:uncharacterized membrane protein YdjX (TVP38/TMEM64 family)
MTRVRRFLPLLILLAAIAALWVSGAADRLSWAELGQQQEALRGWVDARPVLSACLYVALYTAIVALSLPQAVVVTIAGGLLFGTLAGGALAILGATAGAVMIFLIARSAVGDALARRGGAFLQTVRSGLQRDGFNYLLAVRLIPVFPFWLVNLAAALGGMRLLPYAAATLIGIAPGTFVFASIGAGIGSILATGGRPDLSVILSLPVLGPLIGLALLSLLPVAWRRWRKSDA